MPKCQSCKKTNKLSEKNNYDVMYPNFCFNCEYKKFRHGTVIFKCPCCEKSTPIETKDVVPKDYCINCINSYTCHQCTKFKPNDNFHFSYEKKMCEVCSLTNCYYCQKQTLIDDVNFFGQNCCDQCKPILCKDVHHLCMLDKKCCICGDKRSFRNGYSGYIDSMGFVENRHREDFYCLCCRENIKFLKITSPMPSDQIIQ